MSWPSWIFVAIGLIAAVIAVQFDDPWLEVGRAARFVLVFAWVELQRRGVVHVVAAARHPDQCGSVLMTKESP